MSDSLTLKWGTVKGWNFDSKQSKAFELFNKYMEKASAGAMTDRPDEKRKRILCELIDCIDGEIWNDWEGELMTKEEAKKYVTDYGN